MDLKGVFNAEPKSLFDAVSEPGVCFYLPAYQRPYAWSKKNVERVFEDVLHGIENSIRNEDAITFIGTILAIHDTKYQTINPLKKGEVPARVMLIIDGQQRMTTMLLIMLALHEYMRSKLQLLKKEVSAIEKSNPLPNREESISSIIEAKDWLLDKASQEIANLRHFSTDTNSTKSDVFRWYPKIIRAYQDCWSKTEDGASYASPIAKLLHEYNGHVIACDKFGKYEHFKYEISDEPSNEKHEKIKKNYDLIRKTLRKLCADNAEEDGINLLELKASCFKDAFQFDIPEILISDENYKSDRELLNVLVFSKYFLNRVCLTYVTVTDEAYAFDMFEALNTTGEPLTSIETFKPKVIEEETLGKYETSLSKQYIDVIDSILEKISDPNEKHRQTDRIMLAFALSESGEKITKHISDQRRYLIKAYHCGNGAINKKRKFVQNLSHVAKFINEEWDAKLPAVANDNNDEYNFVLLCKDFLYKAKHEISIALVQRYYSRYLVEPTPENKNAFFYSIKACAVFFTLWRAAHSSTSGIDSVYRRLMAEGNAYSGEREQSFLRT